MGRFNFLTYHTPALFIHDECVSTIQKSIRRGLTAQALFFTAQIIRSGYGSYLLKRLLSTIICEDVGLGWPGAAVAVRKAFDAYTASMKGTPAKEAYRNKEACQIILNLVGQMCNAPKSRMMANSARVGLRKLEMMAKAYKPKSTVTAKSWDGLRSHFVQAFVETPAPFVVKEKEKEAEEEWLIPALALYVEIMHVTTPQGRKNQWDMIWAQLLQLCHLPAGPKKTLSSLRRAMKMEFGSPRLNWIQALFLMKKYRKTDWNYTPALPNEEEQKHAKEVLASNDPLMTR